MVGIVRNQVFLNKWSKLAYILSPQVTHARTKTYSLIYISEAEVSAVINPLFAQNWVCPYPPRPVASAFNSPNPPKPTNSSIVNIPPSLGDIPEALPQLLDSNMWTHYNVCKKFSFSAG